MAHRLVTHDGSQLDGALVERLQFIGHTLFREAISRQWQGWTPEQRASVKAVLLSYCCPTPLSCRPTIFDRSSSAAGPRAQLPDWSAAGADIPSGDPSLLPPMKELLGSEGLKAIDASPPT
ncbi:unnamed protein product [Vitrella brassicaformis CCMP3155]|uniref:Uncharacterized protein n=1 Tax=Vitrella brassicaformis (strain CCMP3155) TaxID=1169540 RepID=A0A0G4GT26_VITBC|nr:unnamed protein product [Vitrella brassicaformis CCMP3155]|eukprot:CEM33868.1 unnamed protein product [Vitrella brassicaformis CCMP3155]